MSTTKHKMMRAATAAALLGLSVATQAQVTTSVTRTVAFEYDEYGQLKSRTVEPDDATLAYKLVTRYERNEHGAIKTSTQSWQDPVQGPRTLVTQTNVYDPRSRFTTNVSNALQQSETRTFDEGHGQPLTLTGPNLLSTAWTYDGWGRKLREDRAGGTATTWAYRQCIDTCLNGAVTTIVSQTWAGPGQVTQTTAPVETFVDALDRQVLMRSWGFDGRQVLSQKVYDAQGRVAQVSRPYFAGATPVWTTYDSDALGRAWRMRAPNAAGTDTDDTRIDFNGLSTTTTNSKLQVRTELRNAKGKLQSVSDEAGTTSYVYEPFGNLARTTDPKGNQIVVGYDRLGRKATLADPDLGTWQYFVDPLGRTWKQVDAKGQVTQFTFDDLDRQTRRLEPDLDSQWEYDTAPKGIGKLAEAWTTAAGVKDYRRVHRYDALGRPQSMTISLDGDYVEQWSYDGYGRTSTTAVQRNTRGGSGGPSTSFTMGYNAYGHASSVTRDDGLVLWTAQATDAEGHVTLEQLGNGLKTARGVNPRTGRVESVVSGPADGTGLPNASHQNETVQYDSLGNVSARVQLGETGNVVLETFEYDGLNRLRTSAVMGRAAKGYDYDELGNLKTKAGLAYRYPPSGAGSIRPHALQQISGSVAGVSNPEFAFDGNGNQLSGLGRVYGWTSFNQAQTIDKLNGATPVQRTAFLHGPEHQRTRQTISPISGGAVGAPATTIWYGGAIEKEIDATANTTTIRTQLPLGLGYVEEKLAGAGVALTAAGPRNTRYVLKDTLGSAQAVVDDLQAVLQRMSYDAWGSRRNVDGSDDAALATSLGALRNGQDHSGYTGQEQLDQLGLVHLNGRIYDPISARFISADPTIADPGDTQGLNRFSYVLNNPLRYTDPSGFVGEETNDASDKPKATLAQVNVSGKALDGPCKGECVREFRDNLMKALDKRQRVVQFMFRQATVTIVRYGPAAARVGAATARAARLGAMVAAAGAGNPGNDAAGAAILVGGMLIAIVQEINAAGESSAPSSLEADAGGANGEKPSLLDPQGEQHILDGDGPNAGGGHRHGTGKPGKSEFPANWSDDKIKGEVSDVATDPGSVRTTQPNGRIKIQGTRDGVDITVIVEPDGRGGRIVTGFPTNTPRNP